MNPEQFQRERDFGAVLAIAQALLARKHITADEYRRVRAALIKKYRPVIASLQDTVSSNPPQKTGDKPEGAVVL